MPDRAPAVPPHTSRRYAERAMGTVFSFDLRDASMDPHALDDAIGWLHWVDETFSTYQPGSVLATARPDGT